MPEFNTHERRTSDQAVAMVDQRVTKLEEVLEDHIKEETRMLREVAEYMHGMDSDEHRKKHEFLDMLISREKERSDLRKAVTEKIVTSGVWAAIAGVAVIVYHYLFPTRGV